MIKVISIKTENKVKNYLVKRYSNGTYYMNQVIKGKQFYKRWVQTTKDYAMGLTKRFNGQKEK